MPELPEVETIVSGLKETVLKRTIASIDVLTERSFPDISLLTEVQGKKILSVNRKGKAILIELSGNLYFLIHLMMTGSLTTEKLRSDTRVVIHFEEGDCLYFNDIRKFGYVRLMTKECLDGNTFLNSLGADPLSEDFPFDSFYETLKRKKVSIKGALLDQKVIAGLGNIYVDESLFLSRIHPETPSSSLTKKEVKVLLESIRKVLLRSIELRGSTRRNYMDLTGRKGDYLNEAWVYNREGSHCRICDTPIQKTRVATRGTHFCPHCQKPKRRKS
ncbi:DNA-formamidopyrimidine glycosylase [Guggenheimella bovis]